MDYIKIDSKWNERWSKNDKLKFDPNRKDDKYYVLEMFSYPSGANLHLGHWFNYALTYSFARYKKMRGFNVFQPMGFDAFGLPAENYAIKTGIHPKDSTLKNISVMERQLSDMGAMFDWDYKLYTCDENYYKWTQWLFLQLYKKGLAYRKLAPVNWCDSCNTAIANEQVVDGKCERCGTVIERKHMTQWFFKITDYAEELLDCLPDLDWPEKTKLMQKNWIGKSVGGEVDFVLENSDEKITVFTTRADTLFGVSFVVLAPEHRLVDIVTTAENKSAVDAYRKEAAKASDIERQSTAKEKTGVFTGAYCINPINGERVPVWIADYCLATYGTGAVMGVAAHDDRDYVFCKKHNLKIKQVIKPKSGDGALPYTEYGVMVNSGKFDGLTSEKGKLAVVEALEEKGLGRKKINYRLRDWSVSRQRYWGAPIPVVHCPKCGAVPADEKDLPITLPYDVNFTPDGRSPLSLHEGYMNCVCPKCGAPAKRDPDTLDTFVCSSWYYLRYPDNKNASAAFDPKVINKMLPVDKYVGGAEHACMHLLYARFITKALRDMGYISFGEPFKSLVHQGLILGEDGNKMSKSAGNVINPDKYIALYGSDVFRTYLMFGIRFTEGGPWSDDGIRSVAKFLDRAERIIVKAWQKRGENASKESGGDEAELEYALNHCIKEANSDFETFSFNTAIARLMELVNAMYKYDSSASPNYALLNEVAGKLVLLIAPAAPHFAEELNELRGGKQSVFLSEYPQFDASKLVKSTIEYAVQINSRVKIKITLSATKDVKAVEAEAMNLPEVKELLKGLAVKKTIVIPQRLINFVV